MKTFQVRITGTTHVVVEAEDESHALEVASDNVFTGSFDLEMSVDRELSDEKEIAASIRCSEWHSNDFQKEPYVG